MTGARSKGAAKNTAETLKPAENKLVDIVLFLFVLMLNVIFHIFFG